MVMKKDVAYLQIIKSATLLKDDQGNSVGAIETLTDISELNRLDRVIGQIPRQLDEIGNVPFSIQVKLLRVLEAQRFERVGDHRSFTVDVRIITATKHRRLKYLGLTV